MGKDILEGIQEAETYRAKWTNEKREKYLKDHPENFAGPNGSFPIEDGSDVEDAWGLAGHADDPDKVRSKIKSIAKRLGLEDSLPNTAKEDDKSMNKATEADILRSMPSETHIFAPIERINKQKREVTLRATSEAEDSYGTVIGFDGSKEAFSKWRGNIREMHQNIAVGRALKWDPVENEKAIDITLRVSKGAEDTWQKVLDGTLLGGSIGAKNGRWGQKEINGKTVPYLERYDLVEVSLVDNPSNPDCNISVIRADGIATEVLERASDASHDEPQATYPPMPADEMRAGAKHSADTMKKMHSTRDNMAKALKDHMDTCGCDECAQGSKYLDPDQDGDIDILPSLDIDGDGMYGASGDGSGDGEARAMRALIQTILKEELRTLFDAQAARSMSPHIQRLSGISARLAQTNTQPDTATQQQLPDIERRLDTIESKFSGLDEVRSLVNEVKDLTKRIAEQPQQAQPIVNSAAVNPALRLFQQQPEQVSQNTQGQEFAEAAMQHGQLTRSQQVDALVTFLGGNVNRR